MDDWELIQAYVREQSDVAFSTLSARYLDLVYSAALRQLGDSNKAREVTQSVFIILARKARSLGPRTILAAWLYRTARFVCLEALRAEQRRKTHEDTMAQLNILEPPAPAEDNWREIAPHLDRAMDNLGETDRTAILLRFFQGRSLRELALEMGVSEEAAKKRVARALEKLRRKLEGCGITSSSSVLATALAAHAVHPAPAAVAIIFPTTLAHGTAATAAVQLLTEGTLHMITWSKINTAAIGIVTAILLTGTATVTVQHTRASAENRDLREEQERAAFAANDDRASEELIALENENAELRRRAGELYRLRDTVSQLQAQRNASNPPARTLTTAPEPIREAAERLRELQFEQFLAAGQKELTLNPLPDDTRLEYNNEIGFMKGIGLALRIYASNNGDQFPPTLDQLFATELLVETQKEKFRTGRYEYNVFKNAEAKPSLPAVWWRAPDERGIRVLVLNDGSAHVIREPKDVPSPVPSTLPND